jgi:predicted metalloprotease
VIFSGRTSSPCGPASTGSGPFYCPADKKVYIDPAFYEIMDKRLGASGDFAQAYVIAHEVAHHVQNVTGRIPEVDRARRASSKLKANQLTVRLELQADCYSGAWTNMVRSVLEEGDVKEALNAAFQIGDDTLQARSGGHVNPASFTHGTSEQRVNWFFKGLKAGDISVCDTFSQAYTAL